MYNLIISYVDSNMPCITDHIPWLLVRITDGPASACQRTGLSRRGNSKMRMHQIDESGTVRSICQTVASGYIWATYKLKPVGSNGAPCTP